jgi:ribosomal protein S27AE
MNAYTFESCEAERLMRHRAWHLVALALKSGELVRPATCSRCGKGGVIEAHHNDYREPLKVEWLCRACHRRLHKEARARFLPLMLAPSVRKGEAKP